MPLFTDFNNNVEMRYNVGWIFIGVFVTNMLVNFIILTINTIKRSVIEIKKVYKMLKKKGIQVKIPKSSLSEIDLLR